MKHKMFSEEYKTAMVEYRCLIQMRFSVVDIVEIMLHKFFGYARHPLQSEDRLGNPNINFPIACAFGDRDFLGSNGADTVVRNNKHFASGDSQIFLVLNASHNIIYD